MEHLLADIDAFCAKHGMSASRFGELAVNDKAFVHQLRNGRRVWPETSAKVAGFIADYSPDVPVEEATPDPQPATSGNREAA
jgi:hypothetical protein